MARLPRIVIPNQPLHIMHRGNNRQDIFKSEDDMIRIKEDTEQSLTKANCALHAYVIMTNHLHLLITPKDKANLTLFMQSMANRYARYFNTKYQHTGTMWEGRYKSCLIDSEHYLFTLYRYIEMNPVRAGMVKTPADYRWSSYQHNALGETDRLITEHIRYKGLAINAEERYANYQQMFNNQTSSTKQDDQIAEATMRGEVVGNDAFHRQISGLLSRATKLSSHGGDRKSETYRLTL